MVLKGMKNVLLLFLLVGVFALNFSNALLIQDFNSNLNYNQTDYAPPTDVFSTNPNALIFTTNQSQFTEVANTSLVPLIVSVNETGALIWRQGYYYNYNSFSWVEFNFSGASVVNSQGQTTNWVNSSASKSLNILGKNFTNGANPLIVYVCKKYNDIWKCGCTSNGDSGNCRKWSLQLINVSGSIPVVGGEGSSCSESSPCGAGLNCTNNVCVVNTPNVPQDPCFGKTVGEQCTDGSWVFNVSNSNVLILDNSTWKSGTQYYAYVYCGGNAYNSLIGSTNSNYTWDYPSNEVALLFRNNLFLASLGDLYSDSKYFTSSNLLNITTEVFSARTAAGYARCVRTVPITQIWLNALAAPSEIPVTGCRELNESGKTYVLQNDIYAGDSPDPSNILNCFNVVADNVIFDGQAYSLSGGTELNSYQYGVVVLGNNFTLNNISIGNFGGMGLSISATDSTIKNTNLCNANGIYCAGAGKAFGNSLSGSTFIMCDNWITNNSIAC